MATCFYLLKDYQKAINKATESLKYEKTIQAYYIRGKAYEAIKNFERAVCDFESALELDKNDPQNIKEELSQLKRKDREQEEESVQKMMGFLMRENKD